MTGQGRFEQAIQLRQADVRAENAPLRWLWARKWVETLDDERHMGAGKTVEEAITQLGLGYSMLTAFTSFVAVDSAVVNQGGAARASSSRCRCPEGVSNSPSARPRGGVMMGARGALHRPRADGGRGGPAR
jgi:Ca-activated chloride channel family protein